MGIKVAHVTCADLKIQCPNNLRNLGVLKPVWLLCQIVWNCHIFSWGKYVRQCQTLLPWWKCDSYLCVKSANNSANLNSFLKLNNIYLDSHDKISRRKKWVKSLFKKSHICFFLALKSSILEPKLTLKCQNNWSRSLKWSIMYHNYHIICM